MAGTTLKGENAIKSFRAAVMRHQEYVKMCRSGNGFERHFLALQSLSSNSSSDPTLHTPSLFQDISYKRLKYDVMSTSNCTSPALQSFGFGPTTPECIGLGNKYFYLHPKILTYFFIRLFNQSG